MEQTLSALFTSIKKSLIGLLLKVSLGVICSLLWQIKVGRDVIGRLRLGSISCPTIALIVVDLPAFIVPTTAKTTSNVCNL